MKPDKPSHKLIKNPMKAQDTPIDTEPQRQLRAAAAAIETYRADLGMSKAALLTRFPELGTDKTYGKIIAGDLSELKIEERWLPAYQDVWARINGSEGDFDGGLLPDLSGPMGTVRAYLETREETGNSRFILILGDSGIGKTSAIDILKSKPYGAFIHVAEACEIWKDKRGKGTAAPLLREIGTAIGLTDLPAGRDKLKDTVVKALKLRRRCVVVEEAHHLCPEGINILKTLINLTPVIIIATAMPILWDKLSGSRHAWAECKQLTGNRLAERIHLTLSTDDVAKLIAARCADVAAWSFDSETVRNRRPSDPKTTVIDKAAVRIVQDAVHHGNLKFVHAVLKRFLREIRSGQEADLATFTNAIATEKKRR